MDFARGQENLDTDDGYKKEKVKECLQNYFDVHFEIHDKQTMAVKTAIDGGDDKKKTDLTIDLSTRRDPRVDITQMPHHLDERELNYYLRHLKIAKPMFKRRYGRLK